MARNRVFRDKQVDAIVNLIRTWQKDSISWADVCQNCEPILGFVPSRQGLNQHESILKAFQARKDGLHISPQSGSPMPSSLAVASRRIAMLNAKNHELKMENSRLLDRFIIWQYNAYKKGMKSADLDEPMPKSNRDVDKSEMGENGERK